MAIEDGERKEFLRENQKKQGMDPLSGEYILPPWLVPLLQANYFSQCAIHAESSRNECNLYCLNCAADPICSSCLPNHRNHIVVQIRKSSYHNVIKVSEISRFIDISGVQTYIINSAKIVFLNDRPQARLGKGAAFACITCRRPLLESHHFCSIGCKVRGINRDQMTAITVGNEPQRSSEVPCRLESGDVCKLSTAAVSAIECGEEGLRGRRSSERDSQSAFPIAGGRRSRRKGIPHRASS